MSEPDQPITPDHLTDFLEEGAHEETVACLGRLGAADAETRKRALRAVRNAAEEPPRSFGVLAGPLSTFLTDDDRAVRLTTAKLFVTLAQSDPAAVLPAVDALAERLADDEEFYYVRARCAEALGYVAVDSPGEVTDPGTLADLRIGLSFDEPEVKEKLAKTLAYVALGDPSRLRHQIDSLAEHLDDDNELVRYHLCTALVVVGCEHPANLGEAAEPLQRRLGDANPYVWGRAVEAFGLLAASEAGIGSEPDPDGIENGDEPTTFLDLHHQFEVMEIIETLREESDITVVVVLHDIQQAARIADEMVALKQGAIQARGAPEEVVTAELLADVFEIDAEVDLTARGPRIEPLRPCHDDDGRNRPTDRVTPSDDVGD
ncbi:HEAT repeat domain-containing protein [Halobellus litoreus]|uniref:HEAT repeat domain-containing protein n=1 Tax=Halobellus litoreus TaxID=755310 RepID=A0ABD6DVG9_9EURY|nr:HEAT repeat domain-containing protein [Halobellus litoreus]